MKQDTGLHTRQRRSCVCVCTQYYGIVETDIRQKCVFSSDEESAVKIIHFSFRRTPIDLLHLGLNR